MTEGESRSIASGTLEDLDSALMAAGIDTSLWGAGPTKTLAHLATELQEGDSELFTDQEGLARRVQNVWVDVFVAESGQRRHLVERRQIFCDGRSRERSLPASLGEKCKIGEEPLVAARRALVEELGIEKPLGLATAEPRENPVGEPSYPGLRTVYETYWFTAEIDPKDYKPEGYVEEQVDKRTYFEWEP